MIVLAMVSLIFISPAFAADHGNLEKDPFTFLRDADPIDLNDKQISFSSSYLLDGYHGKNEFDITPSLQWGAFNNGDVEIDLPMQFGYAGSSGDMGDIYLGGFYNFFKESKIRPAFSINSSLALPSGVESKGVGFEFTGVLSKSIKSHKFHINVSYSREITQGPTERMFFFGAAVGYSHPLPWGATFVTSLSMKSSEHKRGSPVFKVSGGLRKQLGPRAVLSLGVGSGFASPEAPDLVVSTGCQYSF